MRRPLPAEDTPRGRDRHEETGPTPHAIRAAAAILSQEASAAHSTGTRQETAYATLWHYRRKPCRTDPAGNWDDMGIPHIHVATRYALKYDLALDEALRTIADNSENIRYFADDVGIDLARPEPAPAPAPVVLPGKPAAAAVEEPKPTLLRRTAALFRRLIGSLRGVFFSVGSDLS